MDPVIKQKWVAALRSGKYKQGRSKLKQSYIGEDVKKFDDEKATYCCLGVLLCVAPGNGKWLNDVWHSNRGVRSLRSLPDTKLKEVGLADSDQGALMVMNDREFKSFAEIADYIEKNL